jgi:sigma-B regulation protein RsbU (phosphoserine phosphatase)
VEVVGGGRGCSRHERFPFEASEIRLEPGDVLLLYTDGVSEAMNMKRELFKESRIHASLESVPHDASAEFIVKNLMKNVSNFAGHAPQSDDITILALRYVGK